MGVFDFYQNVATPEVGDMELQLEQLVLQGLLSPEDAQAALAGESAMGGITLDPALKQKQLASLAALDELAQGGGMTLTDQANLQRTLGDINTQERGAREAILQNAESRGLGGSGLALMSQMKNQQEAATRAAQAGLDTTAQARDRALEALIQGGQMAGNVRSQDFGEQSQVAQAQDAIARFNAANQQQTNLANTAARNDAQRMNLANKQDVANQNVALRNQQQANNKGLLQQDYENKMAKAAGQSGVAAQAEQLRQAKKQADRAFTTQLIGTGISAISPFAK